MISSYQAGIRNVVAIKGSALTEDQIRLIGRFAQKIVLCLDSDFAGNEAAKRGAILAVDMNFEVKVADLKEYKDPDEAARGNPESYKKDIDEAASLWEFLINQIFSKYDSGTGSGKASISKEIIPLLRLIQDKIVQSFYIENVARKLSVPTEAVLEEIAKISIPNKNNSKISEYKNVDKNRRQLLEEKLLVNSVEKIDLIPVDLITSEFIKKIISYLNKNKFPLPKELEEGYAEMVLANSDSEDVNLIIKELTILDIKQKLEKLGEKIKTEENNDELLKEFSELSKKLSTL